MGEDARIIIVGGGIAGASVASALAQRGEPVLLLEMEEQLAYHSTGRSAAVFFENYGPAPVQALTRAGRRFFEDPAPPKRQVRVRIPPGSPIGCGFGG